MTFDGNGGAMRRGAAEQYGATGVAGGHGVATARRAKALPLTVEHVDVEHIRSEARRSARVLSREKVVLPAMVQTRALMVDVAEFLDIDERGASRAVKGRDPFELGDVLALAKNGGPGGLRLARRMVALLGAAIDQIEFAHD